MVLLATRDNQGSIIFELTFEVHLIYNALEKSKTYSLDFPKEHLLRLSEMWSIVMHVGNTAH